MTAYISIAVVLIVFLWFRKNVYNTKKWKVPNESFPTEWRLILVEKVAFYNALSDEEKTKFEYKVQEFLLNCRITGIETSVETIDEVLVASSAVIPIFNFEEWRYTNLFEVLLYPSMINANFETEGDDRRIMGMVGTGYMEGKMVLSKPALRLGFANESDKKNTAIHEFVHLIDKIDGSIDGIPLALLEKQYAIPWIYLIDKKIEEIYEKDSDINPYGGSNRAEFFSVVSEYFFERPKLMARKHPELYQLLENIFKHDMDERKLQTNKVKISRNSPCPCNSGLKFKKCCGKIHYT